MKTVFLFFLTGFWLIIPRYSFSHKLFTTYSYNKVIINKEKGQKDFHTKIDKNIEITTGRFSFYEFQINENIVVIMKSKTSLKVFLDKDKIAFTVIKGQVLFKLKGLNKSLNILCGKTIIQADNGDFKVMKMRKETNIYARTAVLTIRSNREKSISLNSWHKVKIIDGSPGKVDQINDFEKACLNDLKDVVLFTESELLKRYSR